MIAARAALIVLVLAAARDVRAQGQSALEHVPPDPPQTHVHDMSYAQMVEMMGMDDRKTFGKIMLDRLEWRDASDGPGFAWDANAWYGGDYHKAWLQAEGARDGDTTHESRIELGWERIVSAWWSVRAGLRHDAGVGPSREWLGAGVAGLAPGFVETEAAVYLGEDGRSALRLKLERDCLFTQRLVLQPQLELDVYGKDDAEKLIGAGLSELSFGLRLRYEIRREIAPYVGLDWTWRFGETADLAEAAGEEESGFTAVAGLRLWF
ncbi:MAG TPA: copper resistance protein B [Steroidobacteraceae bacterium]|jgi:copper resistance protein B|nr:copper resistance protein B [Steroidobacteraceae bacterium]